MAIFVGEDDPLAQKTNVSPRELANHHWISVGEESGIFDVTRETLDRLGLPDVTPKLENNGDVTMTFRILEKTKSCSMLPHQLVSAHQKLFRIAPVDLNVELPSRDIGLWSTIASRDRLDVVDFVDRLNRYITKAVELAAQPDV